MKVKELKETLDVMSTLKHASYLPVLNTIYIQNNEASSILTFRSTDLEVFIERSFSINSETVVNHCIDKKILKKFVSKLDKNETVNFKGDESGKLIVSSLCKGKSVSQKFKSLDPESFPEIPLIKCNFAWEFHSESGKSDILNKLIEISQFTGRDDHRESLNGIFFDGENNRIVATDGCKLTMFKNIATKPSKSFVFPNIESILKKLKKYEIRCIYRNEEKTSILFSVYPEDNDNIFIITCRLTEESQKYPPIDRIIPEDEKFKFNFQVETDVFEVAKHLCIADNKQEILTFLPGISGTQHKLKIISEGTERNISEVLDTYGDISDIPLTEEFRVGFNADFLYEVSKFTGNSVVLNFQESTQYNSEKGITVNSRNPSRTSCITITSKENPNRFAILMPVKIAE